MKLAGIDLNGIRDFAFREFDSDEDASIGQFLVEGGTDSSAIRLEDGRWIGGPQASIAPHGRGNGWGAIGAADCRRQLRDILNHLHRGIEREDADALRACISAFARSSGNIILSVDDLDTSDEAYRSRLLEVAKTPNRSVKLLWRSVALFLAAWRESRISVTDLNKEIIVLDHTFAGISAQVLRLRADKQNPGHYAPERQGYGQLLCGKLGLSKLLELADELILSANPHIDPVVTEPHRLGIPLLCSELQIGEPHIRRRTNGSWTKLTVPAVQSKQVLGVPDLSDLREWLASVGGERKAFLSSPLEGAFRADLLAHLSRELPSLELLHPSAAAIGSFMAGDLIRMGRPHYFDRLTPISLAIIKGDEPVFTPLISQDETVPANKEYVSPVFDRLEWARGKDQIEFYVLKGETEVRHWVVEIDQTPAATMPVQLQLRQTPGQSWAKLALSSSSWDVLQRSPIALNWEDLKPDPRSPAEILDALSVPPPIVPERIVEPAHDDFWKNGEIYNRGFAEFLDGLKGKIPPPAQLLSYVGRSSSLYDPVSKETRRCWAIGTEGQFPAFAQERHRAQIIAILESYSAELMKSVKGNQPLPDNEYLKALTWCFTLCPSVIQRTIVEALEAKLKNLRHPVLAPARSSTVVIQGAARAVDDEKLLARVLSVLVRINTTNDSLNALGMILTRREGISKVLSEELVAAICVIVLKQLKDLVDNRSFDIKFKNTVTALSGLFRYREVKPHDLLLGSDPRAYNIKKLMVKIDATLKNTHVKVSQRDQKLAIIKSILDWLEGHGSADLLRQIDQLSGD